MNNSTCESCVYYDYDENTDLSICSLYLDEDEYAKLAFDKYEQCPYYKLYDEYKTVQKQN